MAPYVGFVLTDDDPYTIIDLDAHTPLTDQQKARHTKIYDMFDSYTELSRSGSGVHIIVRGKVPRGVRRDQVEVYSSGSYMICTGNVLRHKPIMDRQELLDKLFEEMSTDRDEIDLIETSEKISDSELVERASSASNGDKFDTLCKGDFAEYPSQSEADFALLSMLAFYSDSNEQVRRLFRMSALGKRPKAQRDDYLDRCLRKIRASEPAPIDLSQFKTEVEIAATPTPPPAPPPPKKKKEKKVLPPPDAVPQPPKKAGQHLPYPSGMVGDIAQYVYDSSTRPVHAVGTVAALGLIAGVAGRAYNISQSGLNLYLIFLASTGSGKAGIKSGIDRLCKSVAEMEHDSRGPSEIPTPGIRQFIGGAFASGQALNRKLTEQPCFVSVLGEIGITLQQLCDPRANSAQQLYKKLLLDIYGMSGIGETMEPTEYSDKAKTLKSVTAPCLTIIGESTQESFFERIGTEHILDGLVPRFSFVEYTGKRPRRNKKTSGMPPSPGITKWLLELAQHAMKLQERGTAQQVVQSPEALACLDQFDEYADAKMDATESASERELWNRAHFKALRVSALLAIGRNIYNPVVSIDDAQWAVRFVKNDVATINAKLKDGTMIGGDAYMENEVLRVMRGYARLSKSQLINYRVPVKLRGAGELVPYGYIWRRVAMIGAFTKDRRGASHALQATLNNMVDSDMIGRVPPKQALTEYGTEKAIYFIKK